MGGTAPFSRRERVGGTGEVSEKDGEAKLMFETPVPRKSPRMSSIESIACIEFQHQVLQQTGGKKNREFPKK